MGVLHEFRAVWVLGAGKGLGVHGLDAGGCAVEENLHGARGRGVRCRCDVFAGFDVFATGTDLAGTDTAGIDLAGAFLSHDLHRGLLQGLRGRRLATMLFPFLPC